MNMTFEDLSALAESRYGEAFASGGENVFSLSVEAGPVEFFRAAGDPALAVVRAKVIDLADVPRAGGLAMAALAGNFFWGGTRGATLSVGADSALYATERRPLDELADADGLARCLDDFSGIVADWRERSALYE